MINSQEIVNTRNLVTVKRRQLVAAAGDPALEGRLRDEILKLEADLIALHPRQEPVATKTVEKTKSRGGDEKE